jgi:CRP-like cAMP-binding protein
MSTQNGAREKSRFKLFAPAGPVFLARLDAMQKSRRLRPGQCLPLAKPPGVYLLLSGTVDLYLQADERRMSICTLDSGNVLGLPALLSGAVADLQAEARSECEFAFLPADEFRALLRQYPEANFVVLSLLAQEARWANQALRRLRRSA